MNDVGLYNKYTVKRNFDRKGKHTDCKFFVLDPKHDPVAQVALSCYALLIESTNPALADEVREWLIAIDIEAELDKAKEGEQ